MTVSTYGAGSNDRDIHDVHYDPYYNAQHDFYALSRYADVDEILSRFPEWEVDLTSAELSPTSTVRGRKSMPAALP